MKNKIELVEMKIESVEGLIGADELSELEKELKEPTEEQEKSHDELEDYIDQAEDYARLVLDDDELGEINEEAMERLERANAGFDGVDFVASHCQVVLKEKQGSRELVVLVTREQADFLLLYQKDPSKVFQSMPGQMVYALNVLGASLKCIVAYGKTFLDDRTKVLAGLPSGKKLEMEMPLSEALEIAVVANIPIFVNEGQLYMVPSKASAASMREGIPEYLESAPDEELGVLLQRSIAREEYEISSKIKREMDARKLKHSKNGQKDTDDRENKTE